MGKNNWQVKTFEEIFELKQGKHLPLEELTGGAFPVFGANGMVGYYDKFMYEKETLLVTCRGATCGSINLTKPNSWVTGNAIALVPKEEIVNSFFSFQLKNQSFRDVISGSAQPQIIVGSLKNKNVLVPPLPIQKQIAEILEKAEKAKQKRKEANKLTDEFLQSAFIEMFGDPIKNPNGWGKEKLDALCLQITDGEHTTPIRTENGIKLLSARNIKNGFIDFSSGLDYISEETYIKISKRCKPEVGDVLMSCSGTIGRVTKVRISENFHMVRSVAIMKLKKEIINPDYLEYFLRSDGGQVQVQNKTNKSSQSNIFTGPIKSIEILLPPLSLQKQFAEIVSKTEALKEKQKQSEQELENLFQSLMQKAFKGELV